MMNSMMIIVLFVVVAIVPFYSTKMQDVKKNWVKYRCDPRVMPFASYFGHDTMNNFIQCAQQIQGGVMDEMLAPVHFNISGITDTMGGLGDAVQDVRKVMNQTRGFLGSITAKIFGVFLNITLQFELMTIKVRDLVAKVVGIVATLLYMLTGGVKVGESIVGGPIVGMMKAVCFDPQTQVKLADGSSKPMGEIVNGDVLSGNSEVEGTVQLRNTHMEPLYSLADVKVTGHHKARDETTGRFVYVKDHPEAERLPNTLKDLVCLITSDHLIRINGVTFWDWDD